jgi:hypothetical protein
MTRRRLPAVSTLEQWRWRRTGPKWSKVGRHVRYAWSDVEEWFAAQRRMEVV